MSEENAPEKVMQFDSTSTAPILDYNLPDSTSYELESIVELPFEDAETDKFFMPVARRRPARVEFTNMNINEIKKYVEDGIANNFADKNAWPNVRNLRNEAIQFVEKDSKRIPILVSPAMRAAMLKAASTQTSSATLDVESIAKELRAGKRLNVRQSASGEYKIDFLPEPPKARPRLYLIQRCKLSSFLGNYGVGRTIKTFSLLPGEKTKISVKTFMKTEQQRKESSSILDSYSKESAEEFENSVENESSNKENKDFSMNFHAEASASGSFGKIASASASMDLTTGLSKSTENFNKNVNNALEKHTSSASSKRDVQIDTSNEVKEERGEETAIERQIENINVSRTLNFVFRQMNQEFLSILHLVDARLAFFNGFAELKEEFEFSALDSLLSKYVREERQQAVKHKIIEALLNVYDYNDEPSFIIDSVNRNKESAILVNSAEYTNLMKKIDDIKNEIFQKEKELLLLEDSINSAKEEIRELGASTQIETVIQSKRNEKQQRLNQYPNLIAQAQNALSRAQALDTRAISINNTQNEINKLVQEKQQLENTPIIRTSRGSTYNLQQKKINTINSQIQEKQNHLTQLNNTKTSDDIVNAKNNLDRLLAEQTQLQNEIKELSSQGNANERLAKTESKLKVLESDRKRLEKARKDLQEERIDILKQLGKSEYWRISRQLTQVYERVGSQPVEVPGVILSAKRTIMRTEGIVVDAILGQGDALDAYSHGLQDQAVLEREMNNKLKESEIQKDKTGIEIIKNKDTQAASIFKTIFEQETETKT